MKGAQKRRRKFSRVKTEIILRYKILTLSKGSLDIKTRIMGEGGLCLVARQQLKVGTMLALEMKSSPLRKPMLFTGWVVWSRESNLGSDSVGRKRFDNGIEFERMSELEAQSVADETKDWKLGIAKDLSSSSKNF